MRRGLFALVCCGLLLPAAASAFLVPTPQIASPPPGHPGANGPSDDTTFSQDDRDARLLAYDSSASNLVRDDTNGHQDVFVLAKQGDELLGGRLSLVSVSSKGRQANGDSSNPSLDGTTGEVPHCVAFQSTATNLDRADRSPDSDIYLRDLKAGRTALVSIGRHNATGASIDGRCRFVVFESGHVTFDRDLARRRTLRVGSGSRPDLETDGKGVAYQRGGQVWFQRIAIGKHGLALSGPPQLVSNTPTGTPGNGVSENASVDDRGRYVAFDSTATDLCDLSRCGWNYHPPPNSRKFDPGSTPDGVDANGSRSDVFRAVLGTRPEAPDSMTLVSYDNSYEQLDGPSVEPQISRAGRGVVFTSAPATGHELSDAKAAQNVFYWGDSSQRLGDGHLRLVSYMYFQPCLGCDLGHDFNGSAYHPSMSSRGNFIAFTSFETGEAGETNGAAIPDVFEDYFMAPPRGF
ncbi:MAG TPA: hypothetical protein VGF74_18455 [Thermoleophilaceae bacterium]